MEEDNREKISKADVTGRVVGFSGKIGSGKDHISHLVSKNLQNLHLISFGDALKEELDELYRLRRVESESLSLMFDIEDDDCVKLQEIFRSFPEGYSWTKKNPAMREALQLHGTGIRRAQNLNYWTDQVGKKISRILEETNDEVLVLDARFKNEASFLKNSGIPVIRLDVSPEVQKERVLHRDGGFNSDAFFHSSETELDDWNFDCRINTDSLPDVLISRIVLQFFRKGF